MSEVCVDYLIQETEKLSNNSEEILNKYHLLQDDFEKNKTELTDFENKIKFLERENVQLKQSNKKNLDERDKIINDLKLKLASSSSFSPNLNNDTHISTDQISTSTTQVESKELLDVNMSMKEREKQLLDRELALKKKELELEKKLSTVQQHGQLQQPLYVNNPNAYLSPSPISPIGLNSSPNLSKPQQLPYIHSNSSNGNINRSNHSTPTLPNMSASKFIDPISSGLNPPLDITNGFQQLHQKSSFGSHPIKPTSRKNRKSNLPALGNASSVSFDGVSTSPNILSPVGRRISSMPTQSTNFHTYNTLSENSNLSRQGLGILNYPQHNKNVPSGISGNNHTANSNGIGSRNLTPINTNVSKQQPTKIIHFGSNPNSTSNNNMHQSGNTCTNNGNVNSSNTSMTSPPSNLFSPTPGQSSTSTPVMVSNEKDGTTNGQEPVSNETTESEKETKSKKKFGSLFHRHKK